MGCLMIIAGILLIAYSFGNSYLILLGVVLLIWGFSSAGKDGKKGGKGGKGNKGGKGSRGGSGGDGYTGSVHTGTGTPGSVHRGDGSDVDTYGYGWQDSVTGGRENVFTGESMERDVFGNWTYTDSDGETDDRATFDDD